MANWEETYRREWLQQQPQGAAPTPALPMILKPPDAGVGAPAQPAQPAAATPAQPAGPDRSMPWGTFGSYDNWARQFAGQHGGRTPNLQDEADMWWSQMFANQYGRGPNYGEWVNKYETGEPNKSMPWQLRVGSPYYGEPFTNQRGQLMPEQYRSAVASPGVLPEWLRAGFVPWYQSMMSGQAAPQAQPAPQTVPQMNIPGGSDNRQRYSSGLGVPSYQWYGRG